MAKIAVMGASSYEGRQMLLSLADRGVPNVGFDAEGPGSPVETHAEPFCRLARFDAETLATAFRRHGVTDVIHLPHRGTVAHSLKDPLDAFEGVMVPLLSVLRASVDIGVRSFVLSSTASVYGRPKTIPVPETAQLAPISPLGTAAAGAERMARDVCTAHDIPCAVLRYFNAAGGDPQGRAGGSDAPKHLITAAIRIALGRREGPLKLYGDDYETPDGTAIRDYVHVADVVSAHIDAVDYLRAREPSVVLNCGYGVGASVKDVIHAVERVTGRRLDVVVVGRREGDPPQLIADTAAIRSVLGWRPAFNDFDLIIRTAMDWEVQHGAQPLEPA